MQPSTHNLTHSFNPGELFTIKQILLLWRWDAIKLPCFSSYKLVVTKLVPMQFVATKFVAMKKVIKKLFFTGTKVFSS